MTSRRGTPGTWRFRRPGETFALASAARTMCDLTAITHPMPPGAGCTSVARTRASYAGPCTFGGRRLWRSASRPGRVAIVADDRFGFVDTIARARCRGPPISSTSFAPWLDIARYGHSGPPRRRVRGSTPRRRRRTRLSGPAGRRVLEDVRRADGCTSVIQSTDTGATDVQPGWCAVNDVDGRHGG